MPQRRVAAGSVAGVVTNADPLAGFRDRFVIRDPDLVYFDGNSLGHPPRSTAPAVAAALDEWAEDLVGAWDGWIDLGLRTGDRLAPLLGRRPGSTLVVDSVTVNFYKAVSAVLAAAASKRTANDSRRLVVIADRNDFPTDRYVVAGVVHAAGGAVHWVDALTEDSVAAALDANKRDYVAAVVGSVVSFRTAAIAPVATITAMAHAAGARVVWDVSHAVGAIPLALDEWDVDVAVGCTYKYLHGGPGAPAFVSLSSGAGGAELRQPIHGWMGQRDQFAMGPDYDPVDGVAGWQTGSPPVLALVAAGCGIDIVAEAGIDAVRARSLALGRVLLEGWERHLAGLGFELGSPADDDLRGGHVALRHPEAGRIVRAGRTAKVIADFRPPDIVRLGPGPLTCGFDEAEEGIARLAEVVRTGAHLKLAADAARVT